MKHEFKDIFFNKINIYAPTLYTSYFFVKLIFMHQLYIQCKYILSNTGTIMYIIHKMLINCIVLQEDKFKIKLISNMIYKQVVQFKVIIGEKIKYPVNSKEKYCTN